MVDNKIRKFDLDGSDLNIVEDILNVAGDEELVGLFEWSNNINSKNHINEIKLETALFYPIIYQVEDNCPTCGFRTSQSKQNYNFHYIKKCIEFEFNNITECGISSINCYNRGLFKLGEYESILSVLGQYDCDINVKVDSMAMLDSVKNSAIDGIIFDLEDLMNNEYTDSNCELFDNIDGNLHELLGLSNSIRIHSELVIDNVKSHIDLLKIFRILERFEFDSIELLGFDPFIDTPDEYTPQYSQKHLLKIISIIRIHFPNLVLKVRYAHNGNNNLVKNIYCGVSVINGVYTNPNYESVYNFDDINTILCGNTRK